MAIFSTGSSSGCLPVGAGSCSGPAVVVQWSCSGPAVVVQWRAKVSDKQEGAATTGRAKGRANLPGRNKGLIHTRPVRQAHDRPAQEPRLAQPTLDPSRGVGEGRLQKGPHAFNKLIHQPSPNQLTLLLNRPKIVSTHWAAALHTYEGGIAQAICLSQGHKIRDVHLIIPRNHGHNFGMSTP